MKKFLQKIDTTLSFQLFQLSRFGTWLIISFILVKFLSVQKIIAEFEYSLFLLSLASFFWNIGFKNALLNYHSKSKDPETSIKTVFYLLLLGGFCASIGIGIYSSFSQVNYMLDNRLIYILLFLVFGLSTFPEYVLLLRKKSQSLVVFGFAIHLILLLLVIATVYAKATLTSLLVVYAIWLLVKVGYGVWLLGKNRFKPDTISNLLLFFKYSLPFMFYVVISNGMEYVDGIIVKKYFPLDVFPVYRYGAKEFPVSLILFSALAMASIPLYIQNGHKSLVLLKAKVKRLILILFPLTAVLLLASPFLFEFFYNDLYTESAEIFNIHLLIIFSRAWLPQVVLISKEYIKQLVVISFIEIVINVTISILLMRKMGLPGIAYGTLIAYLVHKGILIIYLNIKEKIKPKEYMPITIYVIFSCILILVFLISQQFLL